MCVAVCDRARVQLLRLLIVVTMLRIFCQFYLLLHILFAEPGRAWKTLRRPNTTFQSVPHSCLILIRWRSPFFFFSSVFQTTHEFHFCGEYKYFRPLVLHNYNYWCGFVWVRAVCVGVSLISAHIVLGWILLRNASFEAPVCVRTQL